VLTSRSNLNIVCLWQAEVDKSTEGAWFFSRDVPHDKWCSLTLPKRCLLMTINQSRVDMVRVKWIQAKDGRIKSLGGSFWGGGVGVEIGGL
jgi:hypothetical protein